MDGWLAATLVTGFGVLIVAVLLLILSVMKTLAKLREVIGSMELASTTLAADMADTMQRTAAAAAAAEARLRELEPLATGLGSAGESLAEAGGQLKEISRKAVDSANNALERAQRRNEPGLEHALRALDAGLTLWKAWNKRK
jgi:uncharacterized protein YoxC